MMDALWPLGYLPGMALSSVIKTNLGFMPTFAFGMVTALLAMLYSMFILKDSRVLRAKRLQKERGKVDAQLQLTNAPKLEPITEEQPPPPYETLDRPKNEGACQVCTSFFDIRNLKLGIKAVFMRREGNKRAKIMLIITVFQLSMLSSFGQHAVLYLYFRRQLAWTHEEYTLYSTIGGLVGGVSQTTVIPFLTSRLRWKDTSIMAFGVCSFIVNMMFSVFARANWVLYTGLFLGTHYWCTASMCRSQLSKIVGAYDVGKLYSTLAFTQALMPLAGMPLFGFMYRATVETYPALFLWVATGVAVLELAFIGMVARLDGWKKQDAGEMSLREK